MHAAAKWVLTLATIYYGFVPLLVDVSGTHLLHPEWSPHARFHLMWLLSLGATTACLALWLLWVRSEARLSAILGLLFNGGFFVAAFTRHLYGGAFTEKGGVEAQLWGLDVGLYAFGGDLILIAVCLLFLAPKETGTKGVD